MNKYFKKGLVLLVLLVFLGWVGSASAFVFESQETQLTTSLDDEFDCAISGDWITFTRYVGNDADIIALNLTTLEEVLVTPQQGSQYLNAIDGSRIVYTQTIGSAANVFVFDMTTGVNQNISLGVAGDQSDPEIDGNKIVYFVSNGPNSIMLFDIVTGQTEELSPSDEFQYEPQIEGDIVAWSESVNGSSIFDVKIFNLATDEEKFVGTQNGALNPSIDAGRVALSENGAIKLFDIESEELREISDDALFDLDPILSGEIIAFVRYNGTDFDIVLHNLALGESQVLVREGNQFLHDLEGNRLVFTDDSAGNMDIYMLDFSFAPDPITDLEISGTPPTQIRFDNPYQFQPTVTNPSMTPLVYSIENMPDWASFDATTGELSGTPELADAGVYDDIIISVKNDFKTVSLPAFRIVVAGINQAPRFNLTGANPVKVCTNAGGQSIPFVSGISDGDFETQQLRFIVENDNPALFGGLLGFGGQPYISAGSGLLGFRGGLHQSGTAKVTVHLMDDGGTADGGQDTSGSRSFKIVINADCDGGAGELFNPGQFDFDPVGNGAGGLSNLSLSLNPIGNGASLSSIGNIPGLDGIGNIPLGGLTGTGSISNAESATTFTATISNDSANAGKNVTLSIRLNSGQQFSKADPRCAIDSKNGLALCQLDSVPSGNTSLSFEASAANDELIDAYAEIDAANDQEFRDNNAQLRKAVAAETAEVQTSNGGGSLGWLSLVLLLGIRRKLH